MTERTAREQQQLVALILALRHQVRKRHFQQSPAGLAIGQSTPVAHEQRPWLANPVLSRSRVHAPDFNQTHHRLQTPTIPDVVHTVQRQKHFQGGVAGGLEYPLQNQKTAVRSPHQASPAAPLSVSRLPVKDLLERVDHELQLLLHRQQDIKYPSLFGEDDWQTQDFVAGGKDGETSGQVTPQYGQTQYSAAPAAPSLSSSGQTIDDLLASYPHRRTENMRHETQHATNTASEATHGQGHGGMPGPVNADDMQPPLELDEE